VAFLKDLSANWPQNLLRPLVVNVLTAVILFVLALSFKPLILDLFRSPDIPEYPLICTAEPHKGANEKEMKIDFFVINRTGDSYSREDLISELKALNPEPDRTLSPDIKLELTDEGEIHATTDEDFNQGKGELRVLHDPETRRLTVIVDRIERRAILKAVIRVSKLRFVSQHLTRGTKGEVLRILTNYEQYQDRCYSK
jgi:hypothetical protein